MCSACSLETVFCRMSLAFSYAADSSDWELEDGTRRYVMTLQTLKKWSNATIVSYSMKKLSGTLRTSFIGRAVLGSKYRTQS